MHWKLAFFSFTLLLGTLVSVIFAYLGWHRHRETGAKAFICLMLATAIWSFAYVMEQFTPGLDGKIFWHGISYLGIPFVPLTWFILNAQITDARPRLRLLHIVWLSLAPIVMAALTLTLDPGNLIWGQHKIAVYNGIEYLELSRTWGFDIFTLYSYLLLLMGMIFYIRLLWRAPALRFRQIAVLGAAVALPLVLNVLRIVFNLDPFHPLDLTPLALTTTGVTAGWFIFRFDLLDILPVARTAIVDSMRDGVIVLNLSGYVVTANAAAQRLLGKRESALAGRAIEAVLPDGGTWVRQMMATATDAAAHQPHLEIAVVDQRGRHAVLDRSPASGQKTDIDLDLSLSALHDARGRLTGQLLILRDITSRKRAREALRRAQHMDSIGLLAGGVAHDFNNLLTSIMARHSLALAQLDEHTPAHAQICKAAAATERAADLTRQLLAYAGKGQFHVETLNINQLIHENDALLETAVPKNVELLLILDHELPPIKADPGQIQQVLMNLILNATEAITPKSTNPETELATPMPLTPTLAVPGRIEIATGTSHIDAALAQKYIWRDADLRGTVTPIGDYVYLEVRDTGTGIAPDVLERIFDPFFTTKPLGRGLGLSALLGVVHAHDGGVRVESTLGQGTTFRVIFPSLTRAVSENLDRAPVATANSKDNLKGTVLVVDDEQPIADALAEILQCAGMSVFTAADGRQGVECFTAHRAAIDLVLLDLQMPIMSGMETLQALRTIDPHINILLSSGYSQAAMSPMVEWNGHTAFIQKPYDLQKLVAKVQTML